MDADKVVKKMGFSISRDKIEHMLSTSSISVSKISKKNGFISKLFHKYLIEILPFSPVFNEYENPVFLKIDIPEKIKKEYEILKYLSLTNSNFLVPNILKMKEFKNFSVLLTENTCDKFPLVLGPDGFPIHKSWFNLSEISFENISILLEQVYLDLENIPFSVGSNSPLCNPDTLEKRLIQVGNTELGRYLEEYALHYEEFIDLSKKENRICHGDLRYHSNLFNLSSDVFFGDFYTTTMSTRIIDLVKLSNSPASPDVEDKFLSTQFKNPIFNTLFDPELNGSYSEFKLFFDKVTFLDSFQYLGYMLTHENKSYFDNQQMYYTSKVDSSYNKIRIN
jgi:hypothetical protein